MPSPAFAFSPQQPPQINNQNNSGINGDGSYNNVNSWNNNEFIIITPEDEGAQFNALFDRYVSKDALHDSFYSPPECHPNTRTTVRNEIGNWIDDDRSEESPLLWLNGPAAVGKSVIAKTISGHDQVVATFFFSTSSDRSATTLSPTLAWQLGRRIPATRKHIIASLKSNGSLPTSQIERQFDLLIIEPLKKSIPTLRSRPVMVIDGVDECIDESMLVRFLRVLVRAGKDGGMPVRFIICSRPEPRIRAILGRAQDVDPIENEQNPRLLSLLDIVRYLSRSGRWSQMFLLGVWGLLQLLPTMEWSRMFKMFLQSVWELLCTMEWRVFLEDVWELYRPIRFGVDNDTAPSNIDDELELADTFDKIRPHPVTRISTIQIGFSKECKQDIARYLVDRFNAIRQPEDDSNPWFQPCDISNLVEASCGHFLYATTIIRLLEESDTDPRDVFNMARCGSVQTPDLDEMYKAILKRAQDATRKGPDFQTELGFLMDSLAILVFLAGNVHFSTVRKNFPVIESLLGLGTGKLAWKLSKMHSILKIVPGESVQVHHRSFLEFLQSRKRSGEYYTPFSTGFRRVLVLMIRAWLRYTISKDNGWPCIPVIVQECYKMFARSEFPFGLAVFHTTLHFLMMIPFTYFYRDMSLGLSIVVIFFLVFADIFIISPTAYILFFNRSIIVPFFHPFLHLIFPAMDGGYPVLFFFVAFILLLKVLWFYFTSLVETLWYSF